MPWKETCPMDEKMSFVAECLRGDVPMAALCEDYGISRKTGYKWLGRYREHGPAGLEDRSRAPHREGRIAFAGRDLARLPSHRAAWLGLGLVPEGRRCFPTLTVRENLTAAARPGQDMGTTWISCSPIRSKISSSERPVIVRP